jgi:hypothetical protein
MGEHDVDEVGLAQEAIARALEHGDGLAQRGLGLGHAVELAQGLALLAHRVM